jgi:secreted trypsin-like serine protease
MAFRRLLIALLAAAALAALAAIPAGGVVGGTRAKPSSYPWFVELPFCGGALIAPNRVATAAHCVAGLPLRDIGAVKVGGTAVRQAIGISVEPGYVRRALAGTDNRDAPVGDVAIVVLGSPVTGHKTLSVRTRQHKAGQSALLLGGGQKAVPKKVVRSAANFEKLRKATLKVISDGACKSYYRKHGGKTYRSAFRSATMLCATDPDGRKPFRSACSGDSGGPLVVGSTLAGIVSWGLRCGGDKDPTVFTDPSAFRAFLLSPSPVLAPVSSGEPAGLSGEAKVGATLTCTSPAWLRQPDRIEFGFQSYRFQHGTFTRQRSASPTYVVRSADKGRLVSCAATGVNAGGFETSKESEALRIP